MHKFFDYLAPDLPVKTIGELAGYIRRFAALFSGGVPVEGHMGGRGVLRHGAARRRCPRPLGPGGPPTYPGGRHRLTRFSSGQLHGRETGRRLWRLLFPLRFRQHGSIIYLI